MPLRWQVLARLLLEDLQPDQYFPTFVLRGYNRLHGSTLAQNLLRGWLGHYRWDGGNLLQGYAMVVDFSVVWHHVVALHACWTLDLRQH